MKRIPSLSSCSHEPVADPEDTARAFNEEDLAYAARVELAIMRGETPPERPKCDDCPGAAHPLCCTSTLD